MGRSFEKKRKNRRSSKGMAFTVLCLFLVCVGVLIYAAGIVRFRPDTGVSVSIGSKNQSGEILVQDGEVEREKKQYICHREQIKVEVPILKNSTCFVILTKIQ